MNRRGFLTGLLAITAAPALAADPPAVSEMWSHHHITEFPRAIIKEGYEKFYAWRRVVAADCSRPLTVYDVQRAFVRAMPPLPLRIAPSPDAPRATWLAVRTTGWAEICLPPEPRSAPPCAVSRLRALEDDYAINWCRAERKVELVWFAPGYRGGELQRTTLWTEWREE